MKNMKKLRISHKLSQQKLAEILHISQQSVHKYENNITSPDINTLMLMADYFNTSVDYLIDYTDIDHKIELLTDTMLNKDEYFLIESYRKLSNKQKHAINTILESYNEMQLKDIEK